MPNKTIYVRPTDMVIFQKAQEQFGRGLAALVAETLRGLLERKTPAIGLPVWELVIQDIRARYGEPLAVNTLDGAPAQLAKAYQQVLDGAIYLRQEVEERKIK